MNPLPSFKTDPKRDATDSIRGYVYQAYQSVLAWIQLKENEILVLEGAEDFDVHSGSSVTTTQVKDVSSNLTLRSEAVVDAINNYWTHCVRNPNHDVVLRFLATAEAGKEQGSPFGTGQKGLEYWQSAELDHIDIEPLRAFLITLGLNAEVALFIQNAAEDELREKLIRRIKWDLGNKPREALEYIIEDKLKTHGLKLHINSHYSCQALPHLLKKVADLLSTKGTKELRFGDFLSCFDAATTVSIPRGEMEAMTSGGPLQQLLAAMLESAEISKLTNGSKIGSPIPIVVDSIARTTVVSNLIKLLCKHRVIFLHGSSGLGKTNLAALISHEIGGSWGWAGFRDMRPEQVKDVLKCAAFEMSTAGLPPFLVLDDIDLNRVASFEKEFISLVFSVTNANGMVIITGLSRPPLQLLPKLWKSEDCELSVPYFDEAEIAEMVRAHGLYDDKSVTAWAKTIQLTTSGHPQLVHARVRNLRAKGWPLIGFNDLSKPEDVERIRSEARNRLAQEFPSENIRVLAYRLSLINGVFSRETAIAVAGTPPPLSLPGEAFDALIGPWIERERENCYRVSPLLKGAANNILSTGEVNAVHGAIALSILNRQNISPNEFGTAFFHAFMAKHHQILFKLANSIITEKTENIRFIYNILSWFTLVSLGVKQKILPDKPAIDLMLRLAQFKLISSSPELDKTIAVIERIEETLTEIEPLEFKQASESLAYSQILNTLEVPIPSSIVIRLLSRIIDLHEENFYFQEISNSFKKGHDDLPDLGENKPAQILFSFQAARISDLDDLSELIRSLDTLPSNKRDQLLSICNSDANFSFAHLLINRAWWNEVKDGEFDVSKALQVFDYVVLKSREWKVPELTKACLVAMSVIQDEYGHLPQSALDILDAADEEFPNEANLINQRAKVLFHAKRYLEALPIADKVLGLSGLSDVDFVFCCRDAGMAAANSGDWVEAERLFLLGVEKTKCSDVQKSMGIGLMADAAFAIWKQGKQGNSLLVLADVLDMLASVPVSDDIRIRHLHATVRHSISWIHFNARGEHSVDLVEPIPGMCSNQNPHEGMRDHRIIDIIAAWQLLAVTEKVLELDIGIMRRAQSITGGKKLLHLAGYDRILALEEIFKKKDFENLIPVLREMIEGLHNSKMLEERQEDRWVIGEIPKLPDGYWDNQKNWEMFYPCMLVASVISTADNPATSLPIARWRTDFSNFSVLPYDIDQFLKVLNGSSPDDSLYQRAAAAIFALRNGIVTPDTLWSAFFRLLDALMYYKPWVEDALENLLVSHWFFATNNQRFAFSAPSWSCSEIERCCLDKSRKGFSKVAAVLDIAAPYLKIRLDPTAKQRLKELSAPG